ncbi:hypothetical protein BKA67DRAFT_559210 [Truncatella angustata]|uniref:Uncharacterized protein n=1 Tax=Truncatella angustata TaxID=152316 RepID=A0A9P8UMV8_9PEZI|nr:uncharacterized protein BKA67DRAFT_559210 [Truncatella angustata]KAH6655003.1 hypothetical protein BKA67DRAFT_559210 [Truncatella angustata]
MYLWRIRSTPHPQFGMTPRVHRKDPGLYPGLYPNNPMVCKVERGDILREVALLDMHLIPLKPI